MVCPFRVVVFVVSLAVALGAAIYSFRKMSRAGEEEWEDDDGGYADAGEGERRAEGEEEKGAKKTWGRYALELYTGKFLYDLYQDYKRSKDMCPVVGEQRGGRGHALKAD